uniref:hypothetical protein n=1 Tax=Thaumasiovibrio occultus TaxID=1891184 RepID=UPI000B35971B|nr:hypothetical protein [Thaumasiovibrio occultus]
MSNWEVIWDLMKEWKKTSATILVVVLAFTSLVVYRAPDYFHGWKVQYELDKETKVRLLTGQCVVNVGKTETPDWVNCERLYGAAGQDIEQ